MKEFLTFRKLAERLKMPLGTFGLHVRNINAEKPGTILPDKVEVCGNFNRHLYLVSRVPKIRAILKAHKPTRGRPWPSKK